MNKLQPDQGVLDRCWVNERHLALLLCTLVRTAPSIGVVPAQHPISQFSAQGREVLQDIGLGLSRAMNHPC